MARKFSSPRNEEEDEQQNEVTPANSERVSNLPRSPQRRSSPESNSSEYFTPTGPSGDQLSPLPIRQAHRSGNSNDSSTSSRRNSICFTGGARPRTPTSAGLLRRPSPTSSDEVQLRRRRVNSLNLETPYHLEYDPMTNRYPMPEAYIEGQELYLHFFHEQVRNAGLVGEHVSLEEDFDLSQYHIHGVHEEERRSPSPQCQSHEPHSTGNGCPQSTQTSNPRRRNRAMSMNLENFHDPVWRQTGRELQVLADAFGRSPGRLLVRQRAEQVDVRTLDMDKFWSLLKALFENGQITQERILVLFFFCSDVAILAIRQGATALVEQLTRWSLEFIKKQICSWVQENGGWSAVLYSGLNVMQQTAVIGTCAALFLCCVIYIRKNW